MSILSSTFLFIMAFYIKLDMNEKIKEEIAKELRRRYEEDKDAEV